MDHFVALVTMSFLPLLWHKWEGAISVYLYCPTKLHRKATKKKKKVKCRRLFCYFIILSECYSSLFVHLSPLSKDHTFLCETAAPSAAVCLHRERKLLSVQNSFIKHNLLKSATVKPLSLMQPIGSFCVRLRSDFDKACPARMQYKLLYTEWTAAPAWRSVTVRFWHLETDLGMKWLWHRCIVFYRPAFAWLGSLMFVLHYVLYVILVLSY